MKIPNNNNKNSQAAIAHIAFHIFIYVLIAYAAAVAAKEASEFISDPDAPKQFIQRSANPE